MKRVSVFVAALLSIASVDFANAQTVNCSTPEESECTYGINQTCDNRPVCAPIIDPEDPSSIIYLCDGPETADWGTRQNPKWYHLGLEEIEHGAGFQYYWNGTILCGKTRDCKDACKLNLMTGSYYCESDNSLAWQEDRDLFYWGVVGTECVVDP